MKVGIVGCSGQMGRELVLLLEEQSEMILVGGCCRNAQCDIGLLAGLGHSIGIISAQNIEQVFKESDIVIEFSSVDAATQCFRLAAVHKVPLVSGTTGLREVDMSMLRDAASIVPILYSPNMSVGIAILAKLIKQAAKLLGADFDIEIIEQHHNEKKDAPSGTALMLAKQLGGEIMHGARTKRMHGEIGISSVRGGSVQGKHEVLFCGHSEVISVSHENINRSALAKGALVAAKWLCKMQAPGLYTMEDVLSFI